MRSNYGESLREFFIKYNPLKLIDLGADVFENATVDTNIIIVTKNKNRNNCIALDLTKQKKISNFEQFAENWMPLKNLSKETWAILSPIENTIKQKIEKIGKPIKKWDININYGIKTGFNEAFIIDTATKEKLCQEDPKSAEIIKPILRGKDIKKYRANWAGLWLIATHNGYKENDKRISRIDVENYPAIKKHLDQYLPQLIRRQDKGDTPYNLRNCAYMGDFEKEKIVWKAMGLDSDFTYIKYSMFTNDKGNFLTSLSKKINIKYILAYFNSKLFLWQYSKQGVNMGSGFEFKVNFVEQIHIPEISESAQIPYITIVNQIIEGKKSGLETIDLEQQIDILIYKLYDLTYDEVLVFEPEFAERMSREEYEILKVE
jgi:hypothetical protein